LFSSSEIGVILEKEAEKSTDPNELDVRKPMVVSPLQRSEELRLYNLGLEFDNFKPWLESVTFKCISWLNRLLFKGDDRGFLKEGVKTYLTNVTCLLANFFFCLHICSL
jgi:hypothetical protein